MITAFLKVYDNLVFENPVLTLGFIIWALFIGIAAGLVAAWYSKYYVGEIVRVLLKSGAVGEDCAVAFSDLGLKYRKAYARNMTAGKVLSKYIAVKNVGDCKIDGKKVSRFRKFFTGDDKTPSKYDLDKAVLYIRTDKKHQADVRYEEKGNGVVTLIVSIAVLFALAVLATFFIPELLDMLDSTITKIKNS